MMRYLKVPPGSRVHSTISNTNTEPTRARALLLYRQLLRGGKKMPTPNRQNFVLDKTRSEFRLNRHLTDPNEIDFCLRLADTNVDTVMVQAEHLTNLFNDPTYRYRDEI